MTMFVILRVGCSWNRGDGLRLGIYGMINDNIVEESYKKDEKIILITGKRKNKYKNKYKKIKKIIETRNIYDVRI